jgi:hypothetical protein
LQDVRNFVNVLVVRCSGCSFLQIPAIISRGYLRQAEKEVRNRLVRTSYALKRTFQIDIMWPRCQSPLRLIALIKTGDTIKKILSAMKLPVEASKLYPARPPPAESGGEGGDWLN